MRLMLGILTSLGGDPHVLGFCCKRFCVYECMLQKDSNVHEYACLHLFLREPMYVQQLGERRSLPDRTTLDGLADDEAHRVTGFQLLELRQGGQSAYSPRNFTSLGHSETCVRL